MQNTEKFNKVNEVYSMIAVKYQFKSEQQADGPMVIEELEH
jgi:hypothetical protein